MTPSAYRTVKTRDVEQTAPADPTQVLNSAGGYTFGLTDMGRLARFLVLGSDAPTYYTDALTLTKENAAIVVKLAVEKGPELVETIVAISDAGRAPKNDPALFALAIAVSFGDDETRKLALAALPKVARIGTHLFMFAGFVEQFRGWGRGLRNAVANWYLTPEVDDLAYQALKYRQRQGWSHRDLLRLSHPYGDATRNALFDYICGREATPALREAVPMVEGFIKAQETGADIPALITEYRLAWEMLPDEALTKAKTWEALIDTGMPMTALMRQLPRLTNLGVLTARSARTTAVAAQLTDAARLRKGRVHPINVLVAHKTYEGGRSLQGQSTWKPVAKIVDALDAGFYAAYGAVEPTGKRTLLALDVSGSMGSPAAIMRRDSRKTTGLPVLSCREVTAAMALVTANVEKDYSIVGFTSGDRMRSRLDNSALTELPISPRQRLSDAVKAISSLPFGGTDCSLPFTEAQRRGWELDGIVVYTDNETYAGRVHPHVALQHYRKATGINTRSVVVGMTTTNFSIADPKDPGMLDCVGMDTSVPVLISDFIKG